MNDVRSIVHEIRNQLAVAVANVEAFRDGILEPTPARLSVVAEALRRAEDLLQEIRRDGSAAPGGGPDGGT